MPKGVRDPEAVTVTDVVAVHQQSTALLGLLEKERDLLDRAQLDPTAAIELEDALRAIESEIKIPRARTMMVSALSGSMSKTLVLTLYHRAIRAMHAMAPIVAIKLAEKMDDHQAPGSTQVLIEMAKGLGLFTPGEPIKAKNRGDLLGEDELRDRTDEDLKSRVLDFT